MIVRICLLAACVAACAPLAHAQDLRLPFDGRWFVGQGGDTLNVNHHMASRSQRFGVDFVKVGGPSGRELGVAGSTRLEDFHSWSQPILAPHDGEVVAAVDGLPDNPLGTKDRANPAGNHVALRVAPDRYVWLAHFRQGSVAVKVGERVARGQVLGRCGNSGNSDLPHLHLHVQDQAAFDAGEGRMPVFTGIDVELSGKAFEDVTWPLVRGLFVQPHRDARG